MAYYYHCEDCGSNFETNRDYTFHIPLSICYACKATYPIVITGQYLHTRIYPNGQKTHFFKIHPHECPYCQKVCNTHEFFCGIVEADKIRPDVLETVFYDAHLQEWEE